jgi:dTDP-4-dehydrorhamnose reductase
MRILILGGDGMLGHELVRQWRDRHQVGATLRQDLHAYSSFRLFDDLDLYCGIDVRSADRLIEVVADFRPQAVVNAVGVVKQRSTAKASIPSLEINALLPHRLAVICQAVGARLIHMSTDCVFSGSRGGYTEDDVSDAQDLYGRSKFLGEVHEHHSVTLRTSIVGTELSRKKSLIEWYLSQRGMIVGYKRAIYTGFTTLEMARIIERILLQHLDLFGLWHVASAPISKYELLSILNEHLGRRDVEIVPDEEFVCDRSLSGERFSKRIGYVAPDWHEMLRELAQYIKRADT